MLTHVKKSTHLPDVVELPVQDAHGLGIRVSLDAAPVRGSSLVASRLHHLQHDLPGSSNSPSDMLIHMSSQKAEPTMQQSVCHEHVQSVAYFIEPLDTSNRQHS